LSPLAVAPSMTTPSHCGTPRQGTKTCACGWVQECGHRGRARKSARNNQSTRRVSGNTITTTTKSGSQNAGTPNPGDATQHKVCGGTRPRGGGRTRPSSIRQQETYVKPSKRPRQAKKQTLPAPTARSGLPAVARSAFRTASVCPTTDCNPCICWLRHQRAGKQKPAGSGPGGRQGGRDERRAQGKWVEIRRGRASATGGRSKKMPAAVTLHAQASLSFPKAFQKDCDIQAR
jgi:hypothetical protein